jgi:DNA end-binding protein Ku
VNVGVKYAPLVREQRTRGRMLCREHGLPIRTQTVCERGEVCETVTGYEHGGGFVVLEDRKALESARDGRLELRAFVEIGSVDPIYFEKTYLVWPDKGQETGYDLLADVLSSTGRAVIGTTVLAKSTKAVMLRWSPVLGCLVAHVCTYDANVAWHDAKLVASARMARPETDEAMREAALTLFGSLDEVFDFASVEDEYDSRLREAIAAQAAGRKAARKEEPESPAPVADLMAALKASVAASKGKTARARRKRVAA